MAEASIAELVQVVQQQNERLVQMEQAAVQARRERESEKAELVSDFSNRLTTMQSNISAAAS